MSLVKTGKECGRDWSLGAGEDDPIAIFTPHDTGMVVNQAIAEEQAAVAELARAWSEKKIDEGEKNNFNLFHNEFHRWLKSVGKPPYSVFKLGLRGIYEEGKRYRERIQDWREIARKAGVPASGPAGRRVQTPEEQKRDDKEKSNPWKWAAIAAGGATVAALIVNKIK